MMRNDCSTGYDHISASFIKSVSEFLVSPMPFIFKQFHQNKSIPRHIAIISPIPKIQLSVELKDYRPVSNLPILSKIYERAVSE